MQSDQTWRGGYIGLLVGFLNIFACGACFALDQENLLLCDQAAMEAAQNSNVPPEILLAITRVETGQMQDGRLQPWPWAVNLDGKSYWFNTAEKAMSFADQQLALGIENFDVGCFQINLRWHGAGFNSLAEVFDPQTNAAYAAQFLSELYAENDDWAQAVAAYHSRTPEFAAIYLEKVKAAMNDLQPFSEDFNATPVTARARPNRFPLLQAGASSGAGSIVPIIDAAAPLIGSFQ